jgi:peptidoglycan/LPS O-acetylase OafA/YrhL
LDALTSVRFLAALVIVFFHQGAMKGLSWAPEWVQHGAGLGYVAVSFFFVLSGFILVYTYAGRSLDLRRFWRARLARLYPIYLFSLLLTAPFFFYGVLRLTEQMPDLAWFGPHLGLTVTLVLTMSQSWVPQAALAWNAPAWAVSVEVFFYVLFPWLLVRLTRLSYRALVALCLASWLLALAAAAAYVVVSPDGVEANASYMTLSRLNALKFNPLIRLPEFLLGMACGIWFRSHEDRKHLATPLALGGVVAMGVILAGSHAIPYAVLHTGLLAPAFAALVLGLALQPRWSAVLEWRGLVLLGESSYALYLVHSFIVGMWLFAGTPPGTPTPVRAVGGVLTSLVVALSAYRFIEEPARRWLRGGPAPVASGR